MHAAESWPERWGGRTWGLTGREVVVSTGPLLRPSKKSNRNNLCHYWPVMTMKASVHQRRHAPCEENETADVREPGALGAKLLGENEDR